MKKTILFFVFLITIASGLAYGEYGAGDYDDGNYGSGTEEPVETTTTATSSGGGGGGGGSFSKKLSVGITFKAVIVKGLDSYFYLGNVKHTMKLKSITNDSVEIEINSEPMIVNLFLNETKVVEVDDDLLEIYLQKIKNGKVATLKLTRLEAEPEVVEEVITQENVTYADEVADVEELPEEIEEPKEYEGVLDEEPVEKQSKAWIVVLVVIALILIGVVWYLLYFNK